MKASKEFTTYVEMVTNEVQKKIGNDYEVFAHEIVKNNNRRLTGIVITKSDDKNIAPIFYLDDMYKSLTVEEAANTILRRYEKHSNDITLDDNTFFDFEKAKGNIIGRLINTEANKENLALIPHIDSSIDELSIVFAYCNINGSGQALITNEIAKIWNADVKDLAALAKENTLRLFPPQFFSLLDDASEQSGLPKEMLLAMGFPDFYLLSNEGFRYGAIEIMYDSILSNFAKEHGDFIIIPSSVNEVILAPVKSNHLDLSDDNFLEYLHDMILEVNQIEECTPPEDVLSNTPYFYSEKTGLKALESMNLDKEEEENWKEIIE